MLLACPAFSCITQEEPTHLSTNDHDSTWKLVALAQHSILTGCGSATGASEPSSLPCGKFSTNELPTEIATKRENHTHSHFSAPEGLVIVCMFFFRNSSGSGKSLRLTLQVRYVVYGREGCPCLALD